MKLFFTVLFFSCAAQAQSVQPGLWQADSTMVLNGLPLPTSKDEECLTSAEAKDLKKTLSTELKKVGCEPTKWSVKGQKLDVDLKCAKAGLKATGKINGTVTAKSYDLSGEAEGDYHNIPSMAKLTLKGKWIKSCTR